MINSAHIITISAEIEQLEQRIQSVTIADNYAVFRECEIKLGELYNQLMTWAEVNNIEKIENGKIVIRSNR